MNVKTKTTVSIVLLISEVITTCIACLLWMLPVSGFIIYPFVCGVAVLCSIVGWFFAKGNLLLRIIHGILAVLLFLSMIADVIFFIGFMTGF